MIRDEQMMRRCLQLAEQALEAGDHPFGAVIVDGVGNAVSEGRNREVTEYDPTWHAEMDAIRQATKSLQSNSLEGLTLYTNGQPCPMCSAAIRMTGISRVVFGAPSPAPLRAHPHPLTDPEFGDSPPPAVQGGLMADQSLALRRKMR
ncbi:MAG: nucleoside deaminase [Bacillota bacterium]